MAQRSKGFWGQGWHYLTDGTFREVYETLIKEDKKGEEAIWEYDQHGFRTLRSEAFETRKIDTYRSILKDPEQWREFETGNMNRYFDDGIVLFPYDLADAQSGKKGKPNLAPPNRYFRIQQDMIKRRFPFGKNNTAGDADLRGYVSVLRYIYSKNFASLIGRRRRLAIEYALVGLVILALNFVLTALIWPLLRHFGFGQMPGLGSFLTLAVCLIALIVLLFCCWRIFELIEVYKDEYQASMRASCLLLGRNLQVRQQDIIAMIPLIFTEADNDKFVLKGEGRLDKWPEEVRKWTKLAFWMAGRVEYNELAMQVHMWRLRRLHFGLKWLATLYTKILIVLGLAGLALLSYIFAEVAQALKDAYYSDPTAWHALTLANLVVAAGCAIYIWCIFRASDRKHPVELDLIENSIITQHIQGHKDVRLHDLVAQQLFREKSALLHEEEKSKR
jgi:hypothetical protein